MQTLAIDGRMIYRTGNDSMLMRRNDREILSSLMKEGDARDPQPWTDPQGPTDDQQQRLSRDKAALNPDRYCNEAIHFFFLDRSMVIGEA